MVNDVKTTNQLKAEVLIAYLGQKAPGLSNESAKRWADEYDKSRLALKNRIAIEFNREQKQDPSH